MPLTPGQVEAYRKDGYVVVRNALSQRSTLRLREAADSFAEQARRLSGDTDAIELDDDAVGGGPARIRRIKSPHMHHETFAAMLSHPPLPVAPALGLFEIQRGLSRSHFAEAPHPREAERVGRNS